MLDTDGESGGSSGIKIPRFHGHRYEDYGLWRLSLRAACRVKGVWGMVEEKSESASSTSTAADIEMKSSRRLEKIEKASGIIISFLGDAPLRVVLDSDDDPT